MKKTTIHQLQKLLDEATESGLECGCQLAIYENGELVADLCSGYTTPDRRRKVEPDTLFPVFSVGKGLFTTAIHRMVEKGALSYSTRLGELWPEFDCEGKEHLLFWHVLTHRSGLSMTPEHALVCRTGGLEADVPPPGRHASGMDTGHPLPVSVVFLRLAGR